MNINSRFAFNEFYIMQHNDIQHFTATLADSFSQYNMFRHACCGTYNHNLMRLFWEVSLAILPYNAICIADSKDANSVLAYIPPKSKEPGVLDYPALINYNRLTPFAGVNPFCCYFTLILVDPIP